MADRTLHEAAQSEPFPEDLLPEDLLPEDLLTRIRERAAAYDRDNTFFTEDFDELVAAGYLKAGVPRDFGGGGLTLTALTRAQRRLAAAAPATALGVNMHLVWGAVAQLLHARGDNRMNWVFDEIVAGEVFAFGISEPKNDAVLLDARAQLTADGEDFLLTGTKVFTTLSPVWTRLGVHARDGDDLVFGFVRRNRDIAVRGTAEGSAGLAAGQISFLGEWNPMGMRATQSWNTQLDAVPLRAADIVSRTVPMNGQDPVVWAIFVAFSALTASVYAGIADRAVELALAAANRDHTFIDGTTDKLHSDPDVAAKLTALLLEHRASIDALEMLTRDADAIVDREDWFLALGAMRNRVTDAARNAVTEAMRIAGTRGYQADSELARLYRDALAGLFHPTSARSLAATVRRTF